MAQMFHCKDNKLKLRLCSWIGIKHWQAAIVKLWLRAGRGDTVTAPWGSSGKAIVLRNLPFQFPCKHPMTSVESKLKSSYKNNVSGRFTFLFLCKINIYFVCLVQNYSNKLIKSMFMFVVLCVHDFPQSKVYTLWL